MPTYQYACTQCDERLEAVQSFTDAPLTECPVCGGALRKVFSAVGVVFKGSGFYKNDSRAASREKAAGDKGGDKSGDKAGGDKGGDKPTGDAPAAKPAGEGGAKKEPAAKTPAATPAAKSA